MNHIVDQGCLINNPEFINTVQFKLSETELNDSFMKKLVLYSTDFLFSYSFLNYLQNKFNVTLTTNLSEFKEIVSHIHTDIIIMDIEPSKSIELICQDIHQLNNNIPIILIYVFNDRVKSFDEKIRKYVNAVFYKPFDLSEISVELDGLMQKEA